MGLTLALKNWVTQELIPQHLKQGILTEVPHLYNRSYFPTTEDIKNMSRKSINKMRKHSFDQDALESFLNEEIARQPGMQYFLRKYKSGSATSTLSVCNEYTKWMKTVLGVGALQPLMSIWNQQRILTMKVRGL